MHTTLSIAIPTYNRDFYLKNLLDSILKQIETDNALLEKVAVFVYDNDSKDETYKVVKSSRLGVKYKKNNTNIGVNSNIFQAYTMPLSDYIWVVGDDETISDSSINKILAIIETYKPALIIARSNDLNPFCNIPELFNNYEDFARFAEVNNSYLLLYHSLISTNIIRRDLFDATLTKALLQKTCYANFTGLVNGVISSLQPIVFTNDTIVDIRKVRAPLYSYDPSIGGIVKNLSKYVRIRQIKHLEWLKQRLDLKKINPKLVFTAYHIKLCLFELKNPLKFIKIVMTMGYFLIKSYIARIRELNTKN